MYELTQGRLLQLKILAHGLRIAKMASSSNVPSAASAAVLKPSEPMPDFAVTVEGPKFDEQIDLQGLLNSYKRIGFQANSLGKAIDIVNKMVGTPSTMK